MNTSKIIKAYIRDGTYSTTEPITQGDYGYILQIEGVVLPSVYRVDFSNDRHKGEALPVYGNENGVEVPEELIATGKDIFAFYFYLEEGFGKTAYTWKIPNDTRAKTGDREPTPTQQDSIDQLVVRSNEAVERAEQAKADAEIAQGKAEDAQEAAETAERNAEQSATASAQSAEASARCSSDAQESAEEAGQFTQRAETAQRETTLLVEEAQRYVDTADSAARDAETYANNAYGYARSASESANTAGMKAGEASESANIASEKASEASGYADTASQKATESAQSASQASGYKDTAEQAKNDAQTAKTDAEDARDDAQTAQELAENAESNAESTVHGVLDSLDIETTSGSIVETHDAFPVSPEKMVMDINPVQNLNGYDSPWVGGGGKNLFDQDTVYGAYKQSDGSFLMTGGNGIRFYIPQELVGKELTFSAYLKIPSGSAITNTRVAVNVDGVASNGNFANTSEYTRSVKTFTPVSTDDRVYITYGSNGSQLLQAKDIQLEIGSTATDYAPYENICPISGWTEINAYNDPLYGGNIEWNQLCKCNTLSATLNGLTYTNNGDGSVSVSGTATARTNISLDDIDANYIVPHHVYALFGCPQGGSQTTFMFGIGGLGLEYGGGRIWTNPSYSRGNSTFTVSANQTVNFQNLRPQIFDLTQMFGAGNEPSTVEEFRALFPNDYYPYNEGEKTTVSAVNEKPYTHVNIQLGQTVYGGKLDVLSGVMTINKRSIVVDSTKIVRDSGTRYHVAKSNIGDFLSTSFARMNKFRPHAASEGWNAGGTFFLDSNNLQMNTYRAFDTRAEFIEEYGELQLCYTLATPIEIQLTPQQITLFKDYNALWADTGDISEFAYRAGEFATKADIPEVPVEDVQVNGTSVVQNKVANIDLSGIEQNAEDIASLEEDIYKPYAVDSSSGAIASFADGADDIPLKSLIVDINPVQDLSHGDPSPENICPISGWTQVNVNHSDADTTNPTTITISLGQTVYGGKLDVLSGVLVITHKGVDMGSLSWSMQAGTGTQLTRFNTAGIANDVSREQTQVTYPVMLDLKAPFLVPNSNPVYSRSVDNAMCVLCSNGTFYATCSLYTSAADFKTAVSGMILVYRLAEPIEIQLTPTEVRSLLGTNNIFADTGDSAVEYRADTTLYIQRLTEPDADMIADSNIVSGQYFMVGNTLYKATANIASGASVIVGTNAIRKSLSEALNEINS